MTPPFDTRLAELGRRIEQDPAFGFLGDLAAAHPQSEAFVVGGIVRDAALGREAKDYDFIVRGVPVAALETFLSDRGRVDLVGRTFGVFKFTPRGWPEDAEPIDIALPRTEHAEGTGGYRDVAVQSDPALRVEDDLARRDYTINAMAWDVGKRMLVDPFGGRADLDQKIIRAVGTPHDRFTEDRSRMLRGLRFAAQLGFTIETDTMAAIRERMPSINEQRAAEKRHEMTTLIAPTEFVTPREVVARELIKSFVADPIRALDLWDDAGAIEALMPELLAMKGCAQPPEFHHEGDVWEHTRLALSLLASDAYRAEFGKEKPSALVILGVLFHDIGKPPTQKTPERDGTNRIRFDGHDKVGAIMTRAIARRLALSSPFSAHHPSHVDTDDLGWVVANHLLLVNDPSHFKPATIERYFFDPNHPGAVLQRVSFCDGCATRSAMHPNGTLDHFREVLRRIAEVGALVTERDRLPPAVLDGNEIMTRFNLRPGPHMRDLITALREAQLDRLTAGGTMTADDAYEFLAPLTAVLPAEAQKK